MKVKRHLSDNQKIITLILLSMILILLFLVVGLNSKNYSYALMKRIPKLYAILLTGGAIGFSSLLFQTVTNNHILTPSILGLDSLYMLLNTIVVFVLGAKHVLVRNPNINFLMTMVVMLGASTFFYHLLLKKKNQNIFFLLLVGVVVGTLFESLTTFLQVIMDPTEFLTLQDKSQASFNNINASVLWLATFIVILIVLYSLQFIKVLDVMGLGRDQAVNLGVDYDKMVKRMLVVVVVLTSVATALVGPITFLGILVVNIGRYFIKSYKHHTLAFTILLLSIIALVGGQLLVERILNFGINLSIIVNFVGGIYFIYLMMKGRAR